jgi:uncharacterized integral membrane protein (TIGR00698 family)
MLEKNLLGVPIGQVHLILPGLAAAALLGWLSTWLSRFIGVNLMGFEKTPISAVMMAILLGLLISNTIPLPGWLKPGFSFAVKKVLRLGIIFLGIRLSIIEILTLGALGIPIVVGCIVGALVFTSLLNRWLGLPQRLGTLIAVGTSICGVSAIVATGPAIEAKEEEVAYAVSVITIFGIIATLIYPYLTNFIFSGNPVKVGLFLGTSIHDTSQVAGAGLVYAETFAKPQALNVATITKLVRNVFMVAVIPLMAFHYTRNQKAAEGSIASKKINITRLLPVFVLGFLFCALLRSIGDMTLNTTGAAFGFLDGAPWKGTYSFIKTWAVNLLVVALAGVGLNTRFRLLRGLGVKPFLVGLGAALSVGVVSFAIISLFGRFIAA